MWFLVALGGLAASVVLSLVLAIAFEMLISIGKTHAAAGGFGAFFLVPMAFVCELIGLAVGFFMGLSGWDLFWSPVYGCLIMYGALTLLWLISPQSNDD